MKLPIVITYKKTDDDGKELRFVLRSIKNIKNWNGEVYVVGDKPSWLINVNFIKTYIRSRNRYEDVVLKLIQASYKLDKFIFIADDIYITKPMKIKTYHAETIRDGKGFHQKSMQLTIEWLERNNYTVLNYDTHTPLIVDKKRLNEVFRIFKENDGLFQWRTIYGNLYKIKSELFEDKKTRSEKLPKGDIISTQFYTQELAKLFPKESKYENCSLRND